MRSTTRRKGRGRLSMPGVEVGMTVIAEKDRGTVRDLLARELDAPVELLLFTRPRSELFVADSHECLSCAETRELLEELTGLAKEKLTLTVHDVAADPTAAARYNVQDLPTVVVRRAEVGGNGDWVPEAPANVRFVGLPSGYEFSTLVADVVDVSKGLTDLSEATRAAVRAIDQPVHLRVFVTPT